MNEHSIGKTIASLRKSKGWTQAELAEKLNVSDKAVSKWESENGLPEISQFPALASLFDVSIDYLMTGKTAEKEIITISKAELCAQKDDITLAEEVKDLPNDENNKNIVDYILQYQSLNVFKKLCEIDPLFIQRFKILNAVTLATLSNSLHLLSGKTFIIDEIYKFTFENENEIKSLLPVEDSEYFRNSQDKCICLLPRNYFTMIVTDKRINETTLSILLSKQNERDCIWYHAFPYLIDEAYKSGNTQLLHRLLDISEKNNALAYDTIQTTYDSYSGKYDYALNYFFIAAIYGKKGHGLVRILESTIKVALTNGDWDLLKKFNEINLNVENFIKSNFGNTHESFTKSKCYIASDDEIRVAKLKLDKSVSQSDLLVQSAIHNGIISIKELIEIKDFAAIKKALYTYPIHPFEILYRMYQSKNWKDLFKFAIDNDICNLADAVLSQNTEEIENNILKSWTQSNNPYYKMKQFCLNSIEIYVDKNEILYGMTSNLKQTNIQDVVKYLNEVRQRIINEISNKFDKEKIVGELTKDYFYSELSKDNNELVIIKLCVRMEAILKCDYKYTGNFAEMIDKYCNEKLTWSEDDGWGYFYTKADKTTIDLLQKLRKSRNSLVHSEKIDEPMSDEEIKQCIDYICSL